jgi:DNA adenine methylase
VTAAPHPIPYQGSKRRLAAAILRHAPPARRLVEPFAGSAAIKLAAAAHGSASRC